VSVHDRPPLKTVGTVFLVLIAALLTLVFLQFRGDLSPTTTLTMLSARAGLVMDSGSKVTLNGVVIGRVGKVYSTIRDGKSMAQVTLLVDSHYVPAIPVNVRADIKASTVSGNKYVALSTPNDPSPARITSADVIDASTVTTEFNSLFETVTSIAEKVALPGCRRRGVARALQPFRTGPAAADRVRVGAPGRREHHQPVALVA